MSQQITRKIAGTNITQSYTLHATPRASAAHQEQRGSTVIALLGSRLDGILGYDAIPEGQPLPERSVIVRKTGAHTYESESATLAAAGYC